MKKVIFIAISVLFAFNAAAANLNPFAYDLKTLSYDANTYTLSLQYKLNAPAKSIKIYAKDSNKQRYLMKTYGSDSNEVKKGTRNITINLLECEESIPRGEYLTWEIDAISTHQTDVECGRKITLYTPFSIDIDNNPESPYFGRIVTSQANNTTEADDVGLYVYDPAFNLQGTYKDPQLSWSTGDWYSGTRLTPFRVRILQDGTGRIFTSAASYKRTTHLWIVNNNDLTDWDPVISNEEMISFTGHPSAENTLGNIGFDFKIDGNNLDILLFSGSTDGASGCPVGYVHSGVFHCTLNNPQTGTYTIITKDIEGARHTYVTSNKKTSIGPIGSFLNSNITYDQYGGIWYTHHSTSVNTTNPGLLHYINNSWKTNYDDGTTLQRQNIGSGAIRYNKHFNRLAISQGLSSAVRLYDVSQQEKQHPTLSNGKNIAITTTADTKYIIDLAWDYASNLYACIRNRDSNLYGVWTIATNLKGDPTTTPAPNKNENRIFLECNDTQYNITINAQVDNYSINTNLGACALKVDNISANWGTKKSVQACEQITVTAVKENKYKFLGWYDGSTKLSSKLEYAFYASKDITLTAKFEFAEYTGMKWYNLLQDGKDYTTMLGTNQRNLGIWRWFQVEYNQTYSTAQQRDAGKLKDGTAYKVHMFLHQNHCQGSTTNEQINKNINSMLDGSNSDFHWLGLYITDAAKTAKNDQGLNIGAYNDINIWGFYLTEFINRSDTNNADLNAAVSIPSITNSKYPNLNGRNLGDPANWRPWWTDKFCELPNKLRYDEAMPVSWKQTYQCPGTDVHVKNEANNGEVANNDYHHPSKWFKWNANPDATNYLLAWRKDGVDKDKEIIHHVTSNNMTLYASYVKSSLQEKDPSPADNNDAKNDDVLLLLSNPNHADNEHNVTLDRKFTANMYNTICLPFDLIKSELPGNLKGADVRAFTGVTTSIFNESGEPVTVLQFTELTNGTDTLHAGVPYLIKPTSDVTTTLTFSGVKYSDILTTGPKNSATYNGITFHGTYNPTTIPQDAVILVANNRLASVTNSGSMDGFRGYFTIDYTTENAAEIYEQAQSGRICLSMSKPATTSVPLAPEAVQPTTSQATKILHNGKIYILRDGKVYTITGARVK